MVTRSHLLKGLLANGFQQYLQDCQKQWNECAQNQKVSTLKETTQVWLLVHKCL